MRALSMARICFECDMHFMAAALPSLSTDERVEPRGERRRV